MKILFLDFDGVLNPIHYENMLYKMWKTSGGLIKSKDEYGMIFFNQSVEHLNRIYAETGCYFVISSTWRKEGLRKMYNMWIDRNMPGVIQGLTEIRDDADRGKEIKSYLNQKPFEGCKYAILDDRTITGHKDHFVQTNGYYGLTSEDANAVIKILNTY